MRYVCPMWDGRKDGQMDEWTNKQSLITKQSNNCNYNKVNQNGSVTANNKIRLILGTRR